MARPLGLLLGTGLLCGASGSRGTPEGLCEAQLPEDRLSGGDAPPTKRGVESVAVPQGSELPHGLNGQDRADWHVGLRRPHLRLLFRPEEQDRRSGANEIVVPDAEGERKVDGFSMRLELAAANTHRHGIV